MPDDFDFKSLKPMKKPTDRASARRYIERRGWRKAPTTTEASQNVKRMLLARLTPEQATQFDHGYTGLNRFRSGEEFWAAVNLIHGKL